MGGKKRHEAAKKVEEEADEIKAAVPQCQWVVISGRFLTYWPKLVGGGNEA